MCCRLCRLGIVITGCIVKHRVHVILYSAHFVFYQACWTQWSGRSFNILLFVSLFFTKLISAATFSDESFSVELLLVLRCFVVFVVDHWSVVRAVIFAAEGSASSLLKCAGKKSASARCFRLQTKPDASAYRQLNVKHQITCSYLFCKEWTSRSVSADGPFLHHCTAK